MKSLKGQSVCKVSTTGILGENDPKLCDVGYSNQSVIVVVNVKCPISRRLKSTTRAISR